MKKNLREQEQKRKPRRLMLSRETLQILDNPALLKIAGGTLSTSMNNDSEEGFEPKCH